MWMTGSLNPFLFPGNTGSFYIASRQQFEIFIDGDSTFSTAAIEPVNLDYSVIFYGGQTSPALTYKCGQAYLFMLDNQTVGAERYKNEGDPLTIQGEIIEFNSNAAIVRSVQHGILDIPSGDLIATMGISGVDSSRSTIHWIGNYNGSDDTNQSYSNAALSFVDDTTIQAERFGIGADSFKVGYFIVEWEFDAGVCISKQQSIYDTNDSTIGEVISYPTTSTDETQTLLFYSGMATDGADPTDEAFVFKIENSSHYRATRYTAGAASNRRYSIGILEFAGGVLTSNQYGTIRNEFSGGAIDSITPILDDRAFCYWTGQNTSGAVNQLDQLDTRVKLISDSEVQVNCDSLTPDTYTGWQVPEFS